MVHLLEHDCKLEVFVEGQYIGFLELYNNPYHLTNCYVKVNLSSYDSVIAQDLFRKVRLIADRPLQVMADSSDVYLTDFLLQAGFVRKRRCYELDVGSDDYVGGQSDVRLFFCDSGSREYDFCCDLLFQHYVSTHKLINPWTSEYDTFYSLLPKFVIYCTYDHEIVCAAWLEDNEIAYICGKNRDIFPGFARALAHYLLQMHQRIFFEADDCDWAAMELRSIFINHEDSSFDTFVLDNSLGVTIW